MDNTNTQQATDQTAAQPAMTNTPTMPAADVTMTPAPIQSAPAPVAADTTTVVTETPAEQMVPGPEAVNVDMPKVEEPAAAMPTTVPPTA